MINCLIKLANFLDKRDKIREANIIDILIKKNAQEETWVDEDTEAFDNATPKLIERKNFPLSFDDKTPELKNERVKSPQNFSDVTPQLNTDRKFQPQPAANKNLTKQIRQNVNPNLVQISETTNIDLKKHPLGILILEFIEKIFINATSSQEELTTNLRELIDNVAQAAIRFDQYLKYHYDYKNNPNPLYPDQFESILEHGYVIINKEFNKGYFNRDSFEFIKDTLDTAVRYYEDLYLDSYLNLPESDYDYLNPDADTIREPRFPPERELSSEEYQSLMNKNEQYDRNLEQSNWLESIKKEEEPEEFEASRKEMEAKMKKEFPEDWHKILFQ